MSVKAKAGRTIFYFYNENRTDYAGAPKMPDMHPDIPITYSFWVYVTNNIPIALLVHEGKDGSMVYIDHDGTYWRIHGRQGSVSLGVFPFAVFKVNTWTCICIAQLFGLYNTYVGYEDQTLAQPWTVPVTLIHSSAPSFPIIATFDHFAFVANSSAYICNFKVWDTHLHISVAQIQCHRWDAQTEGAGIPPIWSCPMRTPGDTASIVNPKAHNYWAQGHDWTIIDTAVSNLQYGGDPQYMGNSKPTPTWIYPIGFPNSFIDPGLTPLVTTTYKAPQFFEFADRGSVTPLDHQTQTIDFYGVAYFGIPGAESGVPPTEVWGLYKDEDSQEVATMGDPAYRFYPGDTVVTIPPGSLGPIKISTMYLWKFGAQFVYNPATPQQETKTGGLAYFMLMVTYQGYPTGIAQLPVVDMAGLFIINNKKEDPKETDENKKKKWLDRYNRGVELKIPDPTVRTAYIGE